MWESLGKVLTSCRLATALILISTAATFGKYQQKSFNNYLVFTQPFGLMLVQQSAYGLHPDLYEDHYRYSPTFTFLMGTFHFLPVWLGVILWTLLNTGIFLTGIFRFLKTESDTVKTVVLLVVFLGAVGAAQHIQSNLLIAGLMLLGISCLREGRPVAAALPFLLCGFIKVYGMAGAVFFLFYPNKGRFLLAMTLGLLVLVALPLSIVPPQFLLQEYKCWFKHFSFQSPSQLSVMGVLASLGIMVNFSVVEGIGLMLFLLPFLRLQLWEDQIFQRLMVANFLVFLVIFNPAAEAPTYILAILGVAIWFVFAVPRRSGDYALLALVLIFASLAHSDLVPLAIKKGFVFPYRIKVIPYLLLFGRLHYLLWTRVEADAPTPPGTPVWV